MTVCVKDRMEVWLVLVVVAVVQAGGETLGLLSLLSPLTLSDHWDRFVTLVLEYFLTKFTNVWFIPLISCSRCRPIESHWLVNDSLVLTDFSSVPSLPVSLYVLPHLWSGVLPRMVEGFRCEVADQLVRDSLTRWRQTVRCEAGTD